MTTHEQAIVVFTDGAAKGNPGPGGWGVVIVTPDGETAWPKLGKDAAAVKLVEYLAALSGRREGH